VARAITIIVTALLLGAWSMYLQRVERSRYWTNMWSAFSIMALAGSLMVLGGLGYELVDGIPVAKGTPVWWEIGAGLLAAAISFGFFRYARRCRRSMVW